MAEDHGPQKPGNSLGPSPEIVERQRVVKKRAAQRVGGCTVQNKMSCLESDDRRRCMKDSRFCKL